MGDKKMEAKFEKEVLDEIAYLFYKRIFENLSWVLEYEKETGKSAFEMTD